jgi:acetyl esterase/lipase
VRYIPTIFFSILELFLLIKIIYLRLKLFNMIRTLFLIFLMATPYLLISQERYIELITDSVLVETFSYSIKNGKDLELDIYSPFEDMEGNRATIIYVHGGGFQSGSRADKNNITFCKNLAELGYVSVSISYRLTRKDQPRGFGCDCPASKKLKTFAATVEDIQDATYFLIQNRESFGIDPQKIILSGSSAGAEAILNAGYQPPMCYDLPSGPVSYAGLISMAGAIPDTSIIYKETAIPSMFFHGTCDNLVPYASAPHHYCEKDKKGYLILHGSYTLAQKLQGLEVPYWLHTTCGGTHELAGKPMKTYFDDIKQFCYQFIINNNGEFKNTIIQGNQKKCDYKQFKFCE